MEFAFTYKLPGFWKVCGGAQSFKNLPLNEQHDILEDHVYSTVHEINSESYKNQQALYVVDIQYEEHPGCPAKRLHCHGLVIAQSMDYIHKFQEDLFNLGKLKNQNMDDHCHYVIHITPIRNRRGWIRYINKNQPEQNELEPDDDGDIVPIRSLFKKSSC